MNAKVIGTSTGIGIIIGIGIGFFVAKDAPQVVEPEPEQPSIAFAPHDAVEPAAVQAPAKADIARCETMLAFAKGALQDEGKESSQDEELISFLEDLLEKSGGASPEGSAMKFPEGLDEAYTPEGFAKALASLQKVCPKAFPNGTRSDCSEFPCRIVASGLTVPTRFDASSCPQYRDYFPMGANSSSNRIEGPDGNDVIVSMITPRPSGENVDAYMKDYEGNLNKRERVRFNDYVGEVAEDVNLDACESGNAESCEQLAQAMRDDPGRRMDYLRKACEGGIGSACNNLAWTLCHDDGQCTSEAEAAGKRATELSPTDGRGAWDTYAFILCKRGNKRDADVAYKTSCENGATPNCGKSCE